MMLTCKVCGATIAVEGYSSGAIIRCSVCRAENEYIDNVSETLHSTDRYECKECGLKCLPGLKTCPACGGSVVFLAPSQQQQSSIEQKCAADENVGSDAFWVNWEKNLGAFSFIVVIGLVLSIIFSAFYNFSLLNVFRETYCMNFLCWVFAFEFVANTIMSIFAIIVLGLFFRRSPCIINLLALYFKLRGSLCIVDLFLVILALEKKSLMLPDISSSVLSIFWSFFWVWYFKKIFKRHAEVSNENNCQ